MDDEGEEVFVVGRHFSSKRMLLCFGVVPDYVGQRLSFSLKVQVVFCNLADLQLVGCQFLDFLHL